MIEGNSHILPETAQVMAMMEAERIKREGLRPEIAPPTFGQIIKNTLITLLGKNVPTP